jgi:putative membrane protein insertion efficiency factor
MIGMVKAYQFVISPWIPAGTCRFEPSCSHYFILAVQKHGPIVGGAKGFWRVLRCNPWGGHGADLP